MTNPRLTHIPDSEVPHVTQALTEAAELEGPVGNLARTVLMNLQKLKETDSSESDPALLQRIRELEIRVSQLGILLENTQAALSPQPRNEGKEIKEMPLGDGEMPIRKSRRTLFSSKQFKFHITPNDQRIRMQRMDPDTHSLAGETGPVTFTFISETNEKNSTNFTNPLDGAGTILFKDFSQASDFAKKLEQTQAGKYQLVLQIPGKSPIFFTQE